MEHLARTSKQIGTCIQRTRKKRGWTQGQLGDRTGLRQGTISLIETGHDAVRLDTLLRILAALDLEFTITSRRKGAPQDIEDLF